ncbi:MAG: prepilin-type N-terminal cleavage/methylation domain-containing protein [Planctomycetaceae bacterium]|nr:prepilin-type N-terminal cleavage/methylation domain-containing protein [Planctomycetaceae bacterium]
MTKLHSQNGVSLLEVLAAIFVVSIGLIGVLAVIPFGAFQVSQAKHAEYASNMLANAVVEIEIRELAKPTKWGLPDLKSAGEDVFEMAGQSEDTTLNCTKFLWIEPHNMFDPPQHIFCIGALFGLEDGTNERWFELMRGQDDLKYKIEGNQRPVLQFHEDGKPVSTGKYSWFFTYLPEAESSYTGPMDEVPLGNVERTVAVDVLACYNRVPTDDQQVEIPRNNFTLSQGGGTFTLLPNADILELLTQTKYVFVTWGPPRQVMGGAWCKIVFFDKSNASAPKVVVTGALPDRIRWNRPMQVLIPSGVLYHKRVEGVPIR